MSVEMEMEVVAVVVAYVERLLHRVQKAEEALG
jgi:hypothetical protein